MLRYDFPGNVRELSNITERALILSKNQLVQKDLIPKIISKQDMDVTEDNCKLDIVEKNHIKKVLEIANSRKSEAAELLGIDRKTLYLKIKRYGIMLR